MIKALTKVEGIPVEAWGCHCAHCGRHDEILGSLSYVKGLFIRYGWEFRHTYSGTLDKGVAQGPDRAYCKACKLKVKEISMDASKLNMSPGTIFNIGPQWTCELPTVQGWYWFRGALTRQYTASYPDGYACVDVRDNHGTLFCEVDDPDGTNIVDLVDAEWQGPIFPN